jgi:hypothetical protein
MQNPILWLIVAIVVVAIIVLVVIALMRRRGQRVGFEPRALPAEEVEGREDRIDEIERMFVHQPREAVAAARLLVDEMLTRMGYPVRLTAAERARDLAHFNRGQADRYRVAGEIRDDANTEEMRRALKGYLDTAREIIGEARGRAGRERPALESTSSSSSSAAPASPIRPAGEPAGQAAVEDQPVFEERRTVVEETRSADQHSPSDDGTGGRPPS